MMNEQPGFIKRTFGDGVGWLGKAAELLSKGGSALVGVAGMLLLISLIQFLPILGTFLLVIITPLLTAGLLTVFRLVSEGSTPTALLLFAGWQERSTRLRLLMLGFWLLFGGISALAGLAFWLVPQMDMDAVNQLMSDPDVMANNPQAVFQLLQGVNLFGGLVIVAVVMAIVLGGLYFAVPLVLFWKWPVISALIWSLRAVLVNWLAFLGFGLMMLVVLFAAGFMFAILVGILSLALGELGALIGQLVVVIVSLFIQLLFAATQWVAFEQVFNTGDSSPGNDQQGSGSSSGDSSSVEL